MDDNTIEFDELSMEVNIDPETVYSLDFGHQMAEGSEVVYMGHHYVVTTVEPLPGLGWRAWVRLDATKNPV